jgi:hypothetical protein
VGQPKLADSLRIVGIEAEGIPVFDNRLPKLLPLEISIAALEIARLLGFR